MKNRDLYLIWGVMFVLCAGLGFIPEPVGFGAAMLTLVSVLFFVPGFILLYRKDLRDVRLIRNLSAASLGATVVVLIANVLTIAAPGAVGNALYAMLIIVSSPMICSRFWALSLFLWACLLCWSIGILRDAKKNNC